MPKDTADFQDLVRAIREILISPNVLDSNCEAANLVDAVAKVATGLHKIAEAIERHASAMECLE